MRDATLLPYIELRLAIDCPNYEDSYSFGYECAQAAMAEIDNPYRENTTEHQAWTEGWWDGFYNEAPLFPLVVPANKSPFLTIAKTRDKNSYHYDSNRLITKLFDVSGAFTAVAIVGYQILNLVA